MKNAPELLQGNHFYYNAFLRLNTGRRVGFGEAAISWREIEEYARYYGLSDEETEDLEIVISLVDKAYLDWRKEDVKRKQAEDKAKRTAEKRTKQGP